MTGVRTSGRKKAARPRKTARSKRAPAPTPKRRRPRRRLRSYLGRYECVGVAGDGASLILRDAATGRDVVLPLAPEGESAARRIRNLPFESGETVWVSITRAKR